MESQPQNPEFRINPENFHPCAPGSTIALHELCSSELKTGIHFHLYVLQPNLNHVSRSYHQPNLYIKYQGPC